MNICFEFLQIALGTRDSLSRSLTEQDWMQFYDFCRRQALLGIGFSAMEKLYDTGVESTGDGACPKEMQMRWMAVALKIEALNRKMNNQCRVLTERLEHDGLRCCVLKGQSHQLVYPKSLSAKRTPGDIDIWCRTPDDGLPLPTASLCGHAVLYGHEAIREYVRHLYRLADANKKPKACYHHIEAPDVDDIHVEVHYRPSFLHSPVRNHRLQRFFLRHADECMTNRTALGFSMLTPSVNVVYQMCHLFSHHLEMGLGLRQLMDYNFALKMWHNDCMEKKDLQSQDLLTEGLGVPVMSREEVVRVLRSFGMGRFAAAVMWVLKEVFAMPAHYYICEPNEKEGRKLLDEIMLGGNFGQYDERGRGMKNGGMMKHGVWKLTRVMRLVGSYPEEALWEPVFRLWHWGWRQISQ